MCGIAGILRVHPPGTEVPPPLAAIPEAWLDILDESIKHRGPDGQGRFRDRAVRPDGTVVDVALVHRRMAVIDLADGKQPMVSSRGEDTVAVVFNGCIYNHRELRKELQAAGHEFVTDHSDTEVLIHGWREWGSELPSHLDGMFAFMIWDRTRGELFVARDRFGEKPLYFSQVGPRKPFTLALSSTVPGLERIGSDQADSNEQHRQTAQFVASRWIRFGCWNQPPGYAVGEVSPGVAGSAPATDGVGRFVNGPKESDWRRWVPASGRRTKSTAASHFDDLLSRAVASRLDSDVPVGCFLSGGVDSSLIAVHAKLHRPDIRAFTVRMPEQRFDESKFAAQVARHIQIPHTVLDCDAHPAEDLVHLIQQLGLPFGDSSLLPTYWVCKAAATQVKVALSGDGADELFGGYRRYQAARAMGMLGVFRHLLWAALPFVRPDESPDSPATRRRRFIEAAIGQQYLDLTSIFPSRMGRELGVEQNRWPVLARVILGVFRLGADVASPLFELTNNLGVTIAMISDVGAYLPDDILRKTDTASMAIPVEVRAPYLDRELSAAALETRIGHLMPGGQRKGLLREVARKHLPSEIVDRPKQGFAIPIGDWFRSDYGGMKQLLMDHLNSAEPWGPASLGIDLNMKFVRQMLDEHMGTGMSGRVVRDHSQRLYMLLVLSIWGKWMGSV